MAYDEILYEVSEHICTLTLNRPTKLNAWTPTMEKEVFQALSAAEKDDDVRVVILTGAGRGFCAGADMSTLNSLAASGKTEDQLREDRKKRNAGHDRPGVRADLRMNYSYPLGIQKPTIAAINGPAAGLGFIMAMYCDIRFASDTAKFSTAFARRGLIAEHGISWLLPRLIGISNALDLLYTARLIDAAEAQRVGFVSRVIPADSLLAEVRKYASELAHASSPRSVRVIKQQVYNGLFQSLAESTDMANEEMLTSFTSADFKEGVAHFVEKRPAAFTGK